MAKRGNFTRVSRKEALRGETAGLPARAAFEEQELAGKTPGRGASPDAAVGTRSRRKIKRVTAQSTPSTSERREALLAFQPKRLTRTAYQPFREELVALVERISFVSTSVDQALLSSGVAYLGGSRRLARRSRSLVLSPSDGSLTSPTTWRQLARPHPRCPPRSRGCAFCAGDITCLLAE